MKKDKFHFVLASAFFALCVGGVAAQGTVFSDPAVGYTFTVPEVKWTMVVRPTPTNPTVEYVYGDRRDGYFTIRKLTIAKDSVMSDVIQNEAQSVQFRPGYVTNKDEVFTGKLPGTVFNFEYVAASHPMAGRYYFLKAAPTTVYVLRFTGAKDSMRSLQAETDVIARSFSLK
ncbi:MAG: hypothetical protein ACJ73D_09935 [Pyrinomonadaceae bacterium]